MMLGSRENGGHFYSLLVVLDERDDLHGWVYTWELEEGHYSILLIIIFSVVLWSSVGELNEHSRYQENYFFGVCAAVGDTQLSFDHAVKVSFIFEFHINFLFNLFMTTELSDFSFDGEVVVRWVVGVCYACGAIKLVSVIDVDHNLSAWKVDDVLGFDSHFEALASVEHDLRFEEAKLRSDGNIFVFVLGLRSGETKVWPLEILIMPLRWTLLISVHWINELFFWLLSNWRRVSVHIWCLNIWSLPLLLSWPSGLRFRVVAYFLLQL